MNGARILYAAAVLTHSSLLAAAERRVPADYATIQQAITASVDGDDVVVASGRYVECVVVSGKNVVLRSSQGAAATIIDGNGQCPVVRIDAGVARTMRVQGFTITGGYSAMDAGGIQIDWSSPTIRDNVIVDNRGGGHGNGISSFYSGPLIVGNHIARNVNTFTSFGGGGAGGIGVNLTRCFDQQQTRDCAAEIYANLIEDNAVDAYTQGGGITVSGENARVVGNVIRNNRATRAGGGIAVINGVNVVIENNLFVGNRVTGSDGQGGAVHLDVTGAGSGAPFVINNTFADNLAPTGSAIYSGGFDIAVRIVNNMIVGGSAVSPVFCATGGDAFPPIVRSNDVVADGAPPYAGRCSGSDGTLGNISVAPRFFGPGDYRLASGSAGIDAGNNAFSGETADLAGMARIVEGDGLSGATIDMGAYELGDLLFSESFDAAGADPH
jgi:hypothetical protein